MSKKRKWMLLTLIVGGILAVSGILIFLYQSTFHTDALSGHYEPAPMQVADYMEMGMDEQSTHAFSGKVEAERMERLYLDPERGSIKEVFISEGDRIDEETELFEYEPAESMIFEKDMKEIELEMAYMEINHLQKRRTSLEKRIKEADTKKVQHESDEEGFIVEPEDKEALQEELDQLQFELRMRNLQTFCQH